MNYKITSKLIQWVASVTGGLIISIETALNFFVPCLLIIIIDVYSAYRLGVRVSKQHPEKSDGKFKSSYVTRILVTMLIIFATIIVANYVDRHVINSTDSMFAVRFVVAVFMFYQIWSILENWSSLNGNKIARALQRFMVNKAERHFNIELKDIFFDNDSKNNQDDNEQIF